MWTHRSALGSLVLTGCLASLGAAAEPPDGAKLDSVVSKLDAIIRRMDALDQRLSRIEELMEMRTGPQFIGTVGPYRISKEGFLYDRQGRQVGIWGVNGQTAPVPKVEPWRLYPLRR